MAKVGPAFDETLIFLVLGFEYPGNVLDGISESFYTFEVFYYC
jgi:hypothetical protein